ncbi:MAG: AI-2E family transporter, partial [Clostridia bacterium]|nr:AI-2E family transporter [Clostridia bacterium]
FVPKIIGKFIGFIPRFFISSIIFFVSCYYFSCDWDRISCFFAKKIKKEKVELAVKIKKQFFLSLKGYTKAYFLLFLLSFSQLFLGLVLLRVREAFSIAFTIAIIDLLPVLGCGTILIPWAIICLLFEKGALGIGLFILYLVILIVRQFAEPKILGSSIGLHPLISLLLVIVGLRFFGFCGMILFPLGASCFLQLKKEANK